MAVRLDIPPVPYERCRALERDLGVPFAVAQVLARRGLGDVEEARAFLAAGERYDPAEFAGIEEAVETILEHAAAGSAIVVHGDYDADGVCSTAILVRVLRDLGARVSWHLPSRSEDGYGLSAGTVERLAAEGAGLLLTADCAITAVEEVALAASLGLDVVVTDHHRPRADGVLPDAPIVHPLVSGYPEEHLCAAGVVHKLAAALYEAVGRDPAEADADLDLVALATVADCVPLRGENRRLVREGLRAIARTTRPGLRALLRVTQADPAQIDESTIGFRLAPRINAAGRLHRADAGVELLLTADEARAEEIAGELDAANVERRHVETRILFAAEAQVAEQGERAAYVLASDDWHPGVIGIVASRLAERHHRPFVLVALEGEEGTGSGRSIPAFDLLAGLDACAPHLLRHGGHRAAAGCTVARADLEAFRAAFEAHAAAVLGPEDLVPSMRVDAVLSADEATLDLAEALGRLAPFGIGNPQPRLLVPGARLLDPRAMGEGKHLRCTVSSGGARASAVAFGRSRLPDGAQDGVDAVFGLEVNRWNGSEEARLLLREACPPAAAPIAIAGRPEGFLDAALAELTAPPAAPADPPALTALGQLRDLRGRGAFGTIGELVATGEPVLVVAACEERRARTLAGSLGGFTLCSWTALERDPSIAARSAHLVALDPPATHAQRALLADAAGARPAHLAWGPDEIRFTVDVLEHDHTPREALAALYAELRAAGERPLEDVLRGDPANPRTASQAGRLLRVLVELGLVVLDGERFTVPPPSRTELERSAAFRAYRARAREGRAWLTRASSRAA